MIRLECYVKDVNAWRAGVSMAIAFLSTRKWNKAATDLSEAYSDWMRNNQDKLDDK